MQTLIRYNADIGNAGYIGRQMKDRTSGLRFPCQNLLSDPLFTFDLIFSKEGLAEQYSSSAPG